MPVLKTLVETEIKARFRHMAAARGLSESELLRAIILTVTSEEESNGHPIKPDAERTDIDRMTVRMPRFLMEATKARAKTKGMAPSRWITALVQSHLIKSPVMTTDELVALQATSRELLAIGRNINQIAHALNSAALSSALHETERVKLENLTELRQVITKSRAAIRVLVRASQNSWEADSETN
ncbi:plasmid mobilization relaxosome protein MobC [Verminephrobacter aporrectodeae]|uniref:plasmid mobilization relaxosome protein MobC n=1 Tax=Verminephrobacter aporrectodeae TaxID=1110389 RepID=UPI00030E07AC|nr:plasmid mobilization relaxosome protein MobC [Verminephrobacter aporrectodeae]